MDDNRAQRRHSKCSDNEKVFRPRCKWTGDDTGTLFGLCVSLLIVLAGTLGYLLCASLLITLVRDLFLLADSLKIQACP
jgi:hypothetical protein